MAWVRPTTEFFNDKKTGISQQEESYGEGGILDTLYQKLKSQGTNLQLASYNILDDIIAHKDSEFLMGNKPKKKSGQDPTDPTDPTGSGYYINYAPMRDSLKSSVERTAPITFQGYQDAIQQAQGDLDAYNDLSNQALESAEKLWKSKDNQQHSLVGDLWYYNTQKLMNSMLQHRHSIGNQFGDIYERMNDLYRLSDDQLDQTNLVNLKEGLFQNAIEAKNSMDTTRTNMYENQLSIADQIGNLLTQARAYAAQTGADFANQYASMEGGDLVDKNGNIKDWTWFNDVLGLSDNGQNSFNFDESKIWQGDVSLEDYLKDLRENTPKLMTIDNLPMIRQLQETNQFLVDQAGRNIAEGTKAARMSANQKDVQNNIKRYG